MTYIERKYGFRFKFDEFNPVLHETEFGCCGFWDLCKKEGFCVIPEKYGDGKKFCSYGRGLGYDKLRAVKVNARKFDFRNYNSRKGVSENDES